MSKLHLGVGLIIFALVALMAAMGVTFPFYILVVIAGIIAAIVLFLAVSPLFKEQLLHDPSKPDKTGMFVQVGTGHSVAIDWGGNFAYAIDGDVDNYVDASKDKLAGYIPGWMLYKWYVWKLLKLHVYVPFLNEPKTYDLFPRYKPVTTPGVRDYELVPETSPSYRSNHVRTSPFTWIFKYTGIDIQTVPFMVTGSAQVVIDRNKVKEALYISESWNILLDQAIFSVTREMMTSELNIDMVLGSVSKNLWDEGKAATQGIKENLAVKIFKGIKQFELEKPLEINGVKVDKPKLSDLGIEVLSFGINDFHDELTPDEKIKLRSTVLARQEGRARDLAGQGIAKEQEHMATVLKGLDPDLRESILKNRAFVDAVNKGGSVETLIAALVGNLRK